MKKAKTKKAVHPIVKDLKRLSKLAKDFEAGATKPIHRDYRIVFNDVMDMSRLRKGTAREREVWMKHRDTFEDLIHEDAFAAMMRALGLMESAYYYRMGVSISSDGVIGAGWLSMLQEARRSLYHMRSEALDGGLCDAMMVALAKNAGFEEREYA